MQFLRDWTLIIAILAGIAGYFIYASIPALAPTHQAVLDIVAVAQPLMIFAMLFLSFLKISVHELRPCRWNWWLLMIQSGAFIVLSGILILIPHSGLRVVLEGAMICLICPTATAAAVVTNKLGGNMAHIAAYTILINLAASILIPAFTPLVHPNPQLSMGTSMLLILGKVFPLLLLPLVLSIIVRRLLPGVKSTLDKVPDLAFYIWAFSLALAIAVTVRSIMHTHVSLGTQLWLVAVSLASCILQFWLGRKIGAKYGDKVTAGQALGQKNTVFAIWIGYTFFSPITAVAGGFYSIWHNIVNSYQLYKHKELKAKQ